MQRVSTAPQSTQTERYWRWGLGLSFGVILISLWEWFGHINDGLLFAPFSQTIVAWGELVSSSEIYQALWISNQAMFLGFLAAVIIGIPLGLLIGRVRQLEQFVDVYLNILLVAPMAALIPVVIVGLGIGLAARVVVVFLFALPVIVVNTRAGLKKLDRSLLEMAQSFGATERQLWNKILLPAAMPSIMTGVRLGLGRALSGMVVVELLLVAVGLGKMLLNAMALFEPDRAYAVIIVIIIEVMILMSIAKKIEKRLTGWLLAS